MRDPDFMIIGAPRSGSTFLLENLMTHPEIFMPVPGGNQSAGDLHFFDVTREEGRKNHDRGLDWYRSLFAQASQNQVFGEKTADYLADPRACQLIHEAFGKIKLVALLRDPVGRAYSHFWHERYNLRSFSDFSAFMDHGQDVGDARVLTSSYYHDSLRRYQETFGSDRVHIIIFDDMHSDPAGQLAALCHFLGIDSTFEFPLRQARINRGTASTGTLWVRQIASSMRDSWPWLYQRLLNSKVGQMARDYVGKQRGTRKYVDGDQSTTSAYPQLSQSDEQRLRTLYREDVEKTGHLIVRNLARLWWGD